MGEITKELNINEKIALLGGTNYMYTNSVPNKGIDSVCMSDGPHGLRKQTHEQDVGVSDSVLATAFPTGATTANGWSRINSAKMGEAIACECLSYDVDLLLGPGINIKRNPLCGRNFEYFSEDPYLASECAISFVKAVQDKNVGVTLKHFALNNSEDYRSVGDSVCDERTMREIYLKPFERVVKNCQPHAVMCAYNKVNGTYCSENSELINGILREEWGFDGVVMTDWGAMHDRVKALKAGIDLEMPGDTLICKKQLYDALKNGDLDGRTVDKSVQRVINLSKRYNNNTQIKADFEKHHELAGVIAQESAVLMKNDGILPLAGNEKLCIIGDLFEKMRYQGSGSSLVNATFITTPKSAFDAKGVEYDYARGYEENSAEINENLISEAVEKAKNADVVLLFIGLTDYDEFESCDRKNMRLGDNQLALIDSITKLNKKVVGVLFGGSVVELPFIDKVNSLLNMFLPGQNGGSAVYNLIFGKANPCGRLAQTWMKKYEDVPFYNEFSKSEREIYKEGLFVGYRYYTTANVKPLFPFGFGLSYTTFEYQDDAVLRRNGNRINVSCNVVNTGDIKGKETVQLYVSKAESAVIRPKRELKSFRQVNLNPKESRKVELSIVYDDLAVYDVKKRKWIVEKGRYTFEICSSSEEVKAVVELDIEGEEIENTYCEEVFSIYSTAKMEKVSEEVYEKMSGIKLQPLQNSKKLSMENRFVDYKQTFFGRILYKKVMAELEKSDKKILETLSESDRERVMKALLFRKKAVDNSSVMQMTMSMASVLPYNGAQAIACLGNGNLLGALIKYMKKIKSAPYTKK